jgi:hypothetical protein
MHKQMLQKKISIKKGSGFLQLMWNLKKYQEQFIVGYIVILIIKK